MAALLYEEPNLGVADVAIGRSAPDIALTSDSGHVWRLSDHIGKVRVLLFYPGNETLVCTKQLCSIRDNWKEYIETKAEIVGISPSTPEEHRKFSLSQNLPIPLLADPDRKSTAMYGSHWLLPIWSTRAIVVIDAKGVIRTRRIMLRAFRPNDNDVLAAIYAARTDALNDNYSRIRGNGLSRFKK